MTKHDSIEAIANVNRRSFLIGTAATGLVLGYAALPELGDAVAAPAPHPFEPTIWYAIGKDGKVVVTFGKAEMGQHISSTMAQLVAEELEASWKDMGSCSPPTIRSTTIRCSAAQVTGGSWSTRNELRHDVPGRRCRPHHADQGRRRA